MANMSVKLSNSALRSTLYAKHNVKNVQYLMQIKWTVSELAKHANMKILFAKDKTVVIKRGRYYRGGQGRTVLALQRPVWCVFSMKFTVPQPTDQPSTLSAAGVTATWISSRPWQRTAMPHSGQDRDRAVPSPGDVSAGS